MLLLLTGIVFVMGVIQTFFAPERTRALPARVRIPRKLDSRSTANWTPVPPQTGRLFQVKLDSRSEATRGGGTVYAVM
ncbi:MAG TPA: hypothetical protein VES73_08460, partial [Lamprocystis sp. (in: g-proteobacteria)]|nr:hypothetical protein [Lamprocystis sp. (in: g-proteobacteria)]